MRFVFDFRASLVRKMEAKLDSVLAVSTHMNTKPANIPSDMDMGFAISALTIEQRMTIEKTLNEMAQNMSAEERASFFAKWDAKRELSQLNVCVRVFEPGRLISSSRTDTLNIFAPTYLCGGMQDHDTFCVIINNRIAKLDANGVTQTDIDVEHILEESQYDQLEYQTMKFTVEHASNLLALKLPFNIVTLSGHYYQVTLPK
jgi:hypothetical protein